MALERGKLSDVVRVSAGDTVGIITCVDSKKVYIKSIICHAAGGGINTATAQVYFCPTGISSASTNKIFDVDGTKINEHGDEHGEIGFCNAVRVAWAKGKIIKEIFYAESFSLVGN